MKIVRQNERDQAIAHPLTAKNSAALHKHPLSSWYD
jgi:hypothetical protein